jgi:hypothetical protein
MLEMLGLMAVTFALTRKRVIAARGTPRWQPGSASAPRPPGGT